MNADSWVKLIEVLVTLIGALSWPLLVLFILVKFGTPFRKFLDNLGEFTFEAGVSGLKATAKRQAEVAALLGVAEGRKQVTTANAEAQRASNAEGAVRGAHDISGTTADLPSVTAQMTTVTGEERAREIANVVAQVVTPRSVRRLSEASLLWVDNHPENNAYERRALEALGIRITLSTSTDDALNILRTGKYDLIITDMGRGLDRKAGYTLLEKKAALGYPAALIIYAGSATPEEKDDAKRMGAFGRTSDPHELLQMVKAALEAS